MEEHKKTKNHKLMKMLVKIQMDDYKDAQMLTEYAEEAKELGNSEIASYFASRAKNRMTTAQDLDRHIESLSRELNMSDGDDGGENPHEMYRKVYRECQNEQCEFLKKKLEKIM